MATINTISCGNGNCFCIEEDGSAILIDTSRAPYREKILASCRDKNMRLIVLTHGHVDHVQNAAALSGAMNVPIAMHRADYGLTRNNMEEPMLAHTLFGKIVLALTEKSLRGDPVETFVPDVFLNDGDTLEPFGVKATILGLPGHTKGSIGIRMGNTDLFVGDALMHILYPAKSLLYGDRARMTESAEKISAYTNATIYFGHGKPVQNRRW